MSKYILNTNNLSIGYQNKVVLEDINLSLLQGELVCMLGANGTGKSTLLRTLAGTQKALSGNVMIQGKKIENISQRDMARIMGLVYTDRTFAGALTVEELVALGRQPHTGFLGRLSLNDKIEVQESIYLAGIAHKSKSYIADLSDGERQKAIIAKALAQQTPIILLDEPTAFLDVASKIEIMKLLHRLARETGKSVLMSTHDISQALFLADRLWVVTENSVVKEGFTEDLIVSGGLDNLFPDRNIIFDTSQGDFRSTSSAIRTVSLKASSHLLYKWCSNALQRNQISVDQKSNINIEIVSPQEILIHTRVQSNTVNSFETLINTLKTID